MNVSEVSGSTLVEIWVSSREENNPFQIIKLGTTFDLNAETVLLLFCCSVLLVHILVGVETSNFEFPLPGGEIEIQRPFQSYRPSGALQTSSKGAEMFFHAPRSSVVSSPLHRLISSLLMVSFVEEEWERWITILSLSLLSNGDQSVRSFGISIRIPRRLDLFSGGIASSRIEIISILRSSRFTRDEEWRWSSSSRSSMSLSRVLRSIWQSDSCLRRYQQLKL